MKSRLTGLFSCDFNRWSVCAEEQLCVNFFVDSLFRVHVTRGLHDRWNNLTSSPTPAAETVIGQTTIEQENYARNACLSITRNVAKKK